MRIGIDVGGTNTDAVLLADDQVIAWCKSPTTADVSSGIVNAIRALLEQRDDALGQIDCVIIGTTHFTNAFVERRNLLPVGVIRIGYVLTVPAHFAPQAFRFWLSKPHKIAADQSSIFSAGRI
ncbi:MULTISPECIES: hydantoinase/oxoprolinase N-terminal domain-containing protein [unclassified Sphingomonas]|jgi:N-methylhydantoinase A/oxoprolinase/acetone carboxylase beta subunit|uniref:hydantoinase/oxoprolinase N-terminal domain-containing protein n=1 Tax=unclassified Sphingomonas TaxID=196159 RepID=UPI00092794E7|nr:MULTISPECIES: hydantoinase/oxoprolinase N-terminal domain-containing protein [unclassified Sphingomonas]OJU17618.1 MAG: hypothetical protein BGN95_18850 [Sphingomonas sp. 66-10]